MENGDSKAIRDRATTSIDHLANEFVSKCSFNSTAARSVGSFVDFHFCRCKWPTPSLRYSSSLGSALDLKVPVVLAPFLAVEYLDEDVGSNKVLAAEALKYNDTTQGEPILSGTLINRRLLTKEGAKKEKYEITVEFEATCCVSYEPGDAFSFLVPNPAEEVEWLIRRLNLVEMAQKQCDVRLIPDSGRKNAKMPSHLDRAVSIQHIFTRLVDIRRFIGKGCVRALADCCTDVDEKRRLLELCSSQGAAEYEEFLRHPNLSILDVLHAFPSCQPSAGRLLEYLPPLQPRQYSAASFYDQNEGGKRIRFLYSLFSVPAGNGRFYGRLGLATGWLTRCTLGRQVSLFLKKSGKFRLTREQCDCPLILVGPGTGIAPFMAFLERIRMGRIHSPTAYHPVWLFFGCRNEALDFLLREELEQFEKTGVISRFLVSFSQDDESAPIRYVQDSIARSGVELSQLILDSSGAMVYVCGDAKRMGVDVFDAFCNIFSIHGNGEVDGKSFMRKMREESRYVEDLWT